MFFEYNIIVVYCIYHLGIIISIFLEKKIEIIIPMITMITCALNDDDMSNKIKNNKDQTKLNQIHIKALNWCSKKARIYHKNVYDNVVIRFLNEGYSRDCIDNVINYIKNIDPIIHFGRCITGPIVWLETEQKLKNLFEIGNSFVQARTQWENNLFNKIYDDNCDFNIRVKYGCLNLMNNKMGCGSATGYGKSYIILKQKVKNRITFVCGDSAEMQPHMCTFDHFVQLLLYLNLSTLNDVIKMANYTKQKNDGLCVQYPQVNNMYVYVEIQIHGDVVLSHDVERIMLYRPHSNDRILQRLDLDNIPYTLFD